MRVRVGDGAPRGRLPRCPRVPRCQIAQFPRYRRGDGCGLFGSARVFYSHRQVAWGGAAWTAALGRGLVAAAVTLTAFCIFDEWIHLYFVLPAQAFRYRTALVTGANSGVGLAVSRAIAQGGGRVYLACRSIPKCRHAAASINSELAAGNPGRAIVAAAPFDVGNATSVASFVAAFRDADMGNAPLDYLVNNAGFGIKQGRALNVDGLESGWGSMHLGHFLLTELLYRAQPTAKRADEEQATTAGRFC